MTNLHKQPLATEILEQIQQGLQRVGIQTTLDRLNNQLTLEGNPKLGHQVIAAVRTLIDLPGIKLPKIFGTEKHLRERWFGFYEVSKAIKILKERIEG
jgi:hypothetical protein